MTRASGERCQTGRQWCSGPWSRVRRCCKGAVAIRQLLSAVNANIGEGEEDGKWQVEPEPLLIELAEQPVDAIVELSPSEAIREHAVLGSFFRGIVTFATRGSELTVFAAVLVVGVSVTIQIEILDALDERKQVVHCEAFTTEASSHLCL